ncbi:hypothetical protein B0H12DRAFT_1066863 [Mycena haematopus]|nr:hypothetical protein B0H12DRAFT_1066863 [Mycena haematopus]
MARKTIGVSLVLHHGSSGDLDPLAITNLLESETASRKCDGELGRKVVRHGCWCLGLARMSKFLGEKGMKLLGKNSFSRTIGMLAATTVIHCMVLLGSQQHMDSAEKEAVADGKNASELGDGLGAQIKLGLSDGASELVARRHGAHGLQLLGARPPQTLRLGVIALSPELGDRLAEKLPTLRNLELLVRDVVGCEFDLLLYYGGTEQDDSHWPVRELLRKDGAAALS